MKKLFTYFLFLHLCHTGYSQVPSSCIIPAPLYQEYEQDIKNMALRRMLQLQHADTAQIQIPQAWIDTIGGGLAAIFNATIIPERDTIFNLYCVHDRANYPVLYQSILVSVDTSYAWTQPWQNLNTITGNSTVDSLMLNYGFSINNFYFWSFANIAELSTNQIINIYALFDSLETVPGVIYAEANGLFGTAGRIDYTQSGQDRYYDFYFEFNDCFDGCDNYRKWSFKVNPDCSVEYLGFSDWGFFGVQPLPSPVNCNLFPVAINEAEAAMKIYFYPNPVNNYLNILFENNSHAIVKIFNSTGQLVNLLEAEGYLHLNMANYKKGVYIISVTDDKGVTSFSKFIKE